MITSADFPGPYPKSSDCLYRIELEEGFLISLQFEDSFDIEDHPEVSCPYDYIKVSRLGWPEPAGSPCSGSSLCVLPGLTPTLLNLLAQLTGPATTQADGLLFPC